MDPGHCSILGSSSVDHLLAHDAEDIRIRIDDAITASDVTASDANSDAYITASNVTASDANTDTHHQVLRMPAADMRPSIRMPFGQKVL